MVMEGDIIWCYGLVTFARFLAPFSEPSWAWNKIPAAHRKNVPTLVYRKFGRLVVRHQQHLDGTVRDETR